MARYANQKQITTKKVRTDAGKPFTLIDTNTMIEACKNLTSNEFKMFMYLSKNSEDYVYNLSQVDVEENTKLPRSTYYRVVDSLIEKGYLYQPDPQVNNWIFTQTPNVRQNNSQNGNSQNGKSHSETEYTHSETKNSQNETENSHSEWRNSKNSINRTDRTESSQSQNETKKYMFDWD